MTQTDITCPECHKEIVGAARKKHAFEHWDYANPMFQLTASKEAKERLAQLLGEEGK